MKKTALAININCMGKITESKTVTAEVTGEWSDGTKVWTDEEGNQYMLKKTQGYQVFILEAIDRLNTSWKYQEERKMTKITEFERWLKETHNIEI